MTAVGDFLGSLFSLEGRAAVVTGAGRGNGEAIAEALGRAGAAILLVDRLEENVTSASARLSERGGRARALPIDLTEPHAAVRVREAALAAFGRIDVLVNNAGVTLPLEGDYPDELWEKTYAVNLRAPFELCREIGRVMKEARRGSILNVTSLNAEVAFPDNPAYVAFKGGLKQLTKAFALDLGAFGVRVNNIGPGYFRTEMTRKSWEDPEKRRARAERTVLGRWGEPADLAGAVVFLASDASAYVTGQDLYVDGGWLIKGL